jgi:hypothetical protein
MKKNMQKLPGSIVALLVLLLTFSVFPQEQDERLMAQAYVDSNALRIENLRLYDRIVLLHKLAPAAFAAGDCEKAEKFAIELKASADEFRATNKRDFSTYDDATHVSNTVLGLVAFERGNQIDAAKYLLAAGRLSHGSPALISFGPNMQLAKKMIEKGDRETVIQYLNLCAAFWKKDGGRLDEWKSIVNQGGMPAFKANLIYGMNEWKHN